MIRGILDFYHFTTSKFYACKVQFNYMCLKILARQINLCYIVSIKNYTIEEEMTFAKAKAALSGTKEYCQLQQDLSLIMKQDVTPSHEFMKGITYIYNIKKRKSTKKGP